MFHLIKRFGVWLALLFRGKKKESRKRFKGSSVFSYIDELNARGIGIKSVSIEDCGDGVKWKVVTRVDSNKKSKGL